MSSMKRTKTYRGQSWRVLDMAMLRVNRTVRMKQLSFHHRARRIDVHSRYARSIKPLVLDSCVAERTRISRSDQDYTVYSKSRNCTSHCILTSSPVFFDTTPPCGTFLQVLPLLSRPDAFSRIRMPSAAFALSDWPTAAPNPCRGSL